MRLVGAVLSVVGAAIVAAGFLMSSEPPCRQCGHRVWGGASLLLLILVPVATIALVVVAKQAMRHGPRGYAT